MPLAKWINTTAGVPVANDFTVTATQGTPLVIDLALQQAYYITAAGVVTPLLPTIPAGTITLAQMANVNTATVFYRKTAGVGAPEVQTLATLKIDLGLAGINSGDQTSIVGITGTLAEFNAACTDADFVPTGLITASGLTMATASFVYRKTAAVGAAEVNTLATVKLDLLLDGANSGNTYKNLMQAGGSHTDGQVAGTYGLPSGNSAIVVSGGGSVYPLQIIALRAADFPSIAGVAVKLRVCASLHCNDVAPTGNFTFGLYPVTRPGVSGGAGVCIYTIGALIAGSATTQITAPGNDTSNTVTGSDFAFPADGYYVIAVVTTATIAVNAHIHMNAFLQTRHV